LSKNLDRECGDVDGTGRRKGCFKIDSFDVFERRLYRWQDATSIMHEGHDDDIAMDYVQTRTILWMLAFLGTPGLVSCLEPKHSRTACQMAWCRFNSACTSSVVIVSV
jgi:hypothetical protein